MNFEHVNVVQVYYTPGDKPLLVGRLALRSRKIFFEYEHDFLASRFDLSPLMLPKKPGLIASNDLTFNGLFGVFNDSLPDGWGHLLLDRTLRKHQVNPQALTVLDRLCFVGDHGMGALHYFPEFDHPEHVPDVNLDEIAEEIFEFQVHDDDRYVEDLFNLGGSSAGARPKILIQHANEDWLVKFRSSIDPSDIGAIEFAYHLMAKEAGLDVPNAKLFPSKKGGGFFGTQRFDRAHGKRIHMHTVSGLLHADHRVPTLDYESIMNATQRLTQDSDESEKQFRLCVFNVLSHNRDDHAKNFSFLMDDNGRWTVSPAYDLTFSSGPSGEHCSMIMGEGKNPGLQHLLELSKQSHIAKADALAIIDEVKSAVNHWSNFAEQAGVGRQSKKMIATAIKNILRHSF